MLYFNVYALIPFPGTKYADNMGNCTKEQWEEMERVHGPIIELTPAIIDAIFNGDDDVVDNAPRFDPGFR